MKKEVQFGEYQILFESILDSDYSDLAKFYRHVFPVHNMFQKEYDLVIDYLKKTNKKSLKFDGGYIVGRVDKKIVCAIRLNRKSQDIYGKHFFWKINHLGVSDNFRHKGLGSELMKIADNIILESIKKNKFDTAKIEVEFVESELQNFYLKFGFELEGKVRSRFRFGEDVYIMGKIYDNS